MSNDSYLFSLHCGLFCRGTHIEVRPLHSEQVETKPVQSPAPCFHTSRACCRRLNRLCGLVDVIFSLFLPFRVNFGQEFFSKTYHASVIS